MRYSLIMKSCAFWKEYHSGLSGSGNQDSSGCVMAICSGVMGSSLCQTPVAR